MSAALQSLGELGAPRRPWRRIFFSLGAVAAIALLAGFALREQFERLALASMLHAATGYHVTLDGVRHERGRLVLLGLHAYSRGGGMVIDVSRIDVVQRDGATRLAVAAPRLALLPSRWLGDERRRLFEGANKLHLDRNRLDAVVRDGALVIASGDPVPQLAAQFADLNGAVHLSRGTLSYELRLALLDGETRYPITAQAVRDAPGTVTARWHAAALPLSPFGGAIPRTAPVAVDGGWLEDATFTYGSSMASRLRATLSGVRLRLHSAQMHLLQNLNGDFEVGERSLGSKGLTATLDGLPFSFVGEVNDLDSRLGWIVSGTPDLRRIARLTFTIAAEPKLQSLRVEATAPGLAFAQYAIITDNGPLAVSSLLFDPHEPTLRFDTAIAENHVFSGGERTSAMGVRTHAVAGVNGDYFDIGGTYQPQGMLIRSGMLVRGPTDHYALAIRRDRTIVFNEYRLRGFVRTPRGTYPVTQFNNWPAGDVTVVTPDFGKALPAWPQITFVALRPLEGEAGRYVVEHVKPVKAAIPVVFGLAFGPKIKGPIPRVGDQVSLSYRLEPEIGDVVAALGGGPLLLKDGAWYEDRHAPAPAERDVRWPVIALARLGDDALALVAVDGRHPERSIGMMRPEFAALLRRLGAIDAMALDSGGSVTLVARAPGDENVSVRNQPSDSSAERWVSDALFLYSSAQPPELLVPQTATTPVAEARPTP